MKVEHLDCREVIERNRLIYFFKPQKNKMKLAIIEAQPNINIVVDSGKNLNNEMPVNNAITAVRAYARNVPSFA